MPILRDNNYFMVPDGFMVLPESEYKRLRKLEDEYDNMVDMLKACADRLEFDGGWDLHFEIKALLNEIEEGEE